MKIVLVLVAAILVTCEKAVSKKERKQLIGKWRLLGPQNHSDDFEGNRQSNPESTWSIEFTNKKVVYFNNGSSIEEGKYQINSSEMQIEFYNQAGKLTNSWLWHTLNVTNMRMSGLNMTPSGEFEFQLERIS